MSQRSPDERLFDLLQSALTLPPELWKEHIHSLCPDDAALAETALRHLHSSAEALNWKGLPRVTSALQTTRSALTRSSAGKTVNARAVLESLFARPFDLKRYELKETLGEGHGGIVYRAHDKLLDRNLALKLIDIGTLDRDTSAPSARALRFVREAQITATLNDPAVVAIHDVAACAETGTGYFTMTLVEGKTVARAISEQGSELPDAASFMADCVRALAHAHAQDFVHGDISWNNVMVTKQGSGFLMDWEMARGPSGTDVQEALITTPAFTGPPGGGTTWFLSPQRARNLSRRPTASDDIFSLGAVLYTALSGHPPFADRLTEHAARVDVIAHIGSDSRPTPLTRRAGSEELIAICNQAMAPLETSRYASADDFLDDLRRHSALLPVRAHKPTMMYRAGLFTRRRPRLTSAIAAVSALGFTTSLAVAAILERKNTHITEQRQEVQASQDFLVRMFERANPGSNPDLTVGPKQLVDAALDDLEALSEQASLHARLSIVLARICMFLGRHEDAARLSADALVWARHEYPDGDAKLAPFVFMGGWTSHLSMDPTQRAKLLDEAAELHLLAPTINWVDHVKALSNAAAVRSSEQDHERAVQTARENLGATHPTTILARLSLATYRHRFTANHALGASELQELAEECERAGDVPLYHHLLVRYELATAYADQRTLDILTEDRKVALEALGEYNSFVAGYDVRIGNIQSSIGALDEAIESQRRLVEYSRQNEGDTNLSVALNNLGSSLYRAEHVNESEVILREALKLARKTMDSGDVRLGNTLTHLARSARKNGATDEGEALFREAVLVYENGSDLASIQCIHGRLMLARHLRDHGQPEEALENIQTCVARLSDLTPPNTSLLAQTYGELEALYVSTGDAEAAVSARERKDALQKD